MPRKLTKEEINEALASRGVAIIGDYVDTQTKTTFTCSNGHTWVTTPTSVRRGTGCRKCELDAKRGVPKLSVEEVESRLNKVGLRIDGTYVEPRRKYNFVCSEGHVWHATFHSVIKSNGCLTCTGRVTKLSKEIVNARIAHKGIRIVGEYKHSHSPTLFECGVGHRWTTIPNHVMRTSACPTCATSGFKKDLPARVYFLEIVDENLSGPVYKVGITNGEVDVRLYHLTRNKRVAVTLLGEIAFDKGSKARKLEQGIRAKYKQYRYMNGKGLLTSGYTELFTVNIWSLVLNNEEADTAKQSPPANTR